MVMVDSNTIAATFRGNQLLLLLNPAIHVVIGELGPPPSQGLRRPLGCPGAVWTLGPTVGLMCRCHGIPKRPVSILGAVLSQQSGRTKASLWTRVSQRVSPAEGQVDRLLFEQPQVDVAGSTSSLVPLSVPGLAGGPAVDAEVVVKEPRQVAGILQNYHRRSNMKIKSRQPIGQLIILRCLIEFKSLDLQRRHLPVSTGAASILSNEAHLLFDP